MMHGEWTSPRLGWNAPGSSISIWILVRGGAGTSGVEIIMVGWYQTKGSMGRTEPIARKVRWYVSVQLLAANGMCV